MLSEICADFCSYTSHWYCLLFPEWMIRVTNSLNLDCSKSIENLNKFQTISAYWNSSLIKIFADIVEMKYFKNRKVHLCFILDKSEMFFLGGWSYFSLRIFHDPDRRALQDLTLFYNLTAVVYLGKWLFRKVSSHFLSDRHILLT